MTNPLRDRMGGFPQNGHGVSLGISRFTHAECTLVRAGCGYWWNLNSEKGILPANGERSGAAAARVYV